MAQFSKVFFPYDPLPAQDLNDIVGFMNGIADGTNFENDAITPDSLSQKRWSASGALNIATTGIKTVSGLEFRPRVVEIYGLFALSSTNARTSTGGFDDTSQWVALTTVSASNVLVSNDANRCLWAASVPAGSTQVSVTKNAITNDGFSVNVGTADSAIISSLRWVAIA